MKKYFSFNSFRFLTTGHKRSITAKKHIVLSFVYRGIDVIIGLLLVSLFLKYLDEENYGIWLVFSSIISYFQFVDIGIDNGFRNKFAEALAKGKAEDLKKYVSTTYAIISIVSFLFITVFLVVNFFLDWSVIVNTSELLKSELSVLAIFLFASFSMILILKIPITIALAYQRASIRSLKNAIEKILKLIFIIFAIYYLPRSLLIIGSAYSIIPVLVLIGLNIYFYSKKFYHLIPSFKYIEVGYVRQLFTLGVKFFIINIAGVVLYTSDNLIITQLFGPEDVVPYQIAHKYFSITLLIFMVVIQPLWSAVTDAYNRDDIIWIKRTVLKIQKIWLLFVFINLALLLASQFVYDFWLDKKVFIPISLSASWALYIIIQSLLSVYTNVINGIGKIKLETITSIISMIINIPLSLFLATTLKMGSSGVVFATIFSLTIGLIFRIVQYKKLISNKAHGIWNT
jgi:O-antigen/teichoic acid export membrane protein